MKYLIHWKYKDKPLTNYSMIEADSKTAAMEAIIDMHPVAKIEFISVKEKANA